MNKFLIYKYFRFISDKNIYQLFKYAMQKFTIHKSVYLGVDNEHEKAFPFLKLITNELPASAVRPEKQLWWSFYLYNLSLNAIK